jgi:hypothetical protein
MTKAEQTRLWAWRFKVLRRAGESSRNGCRLSRRLSGRRDATPIPAGEGQVEIAEVVDPWLAPDRRYFKV